MSHCLIQNVLRWNKTEAAKVAQLVEAYSADSESVTPVVVITWEQGPSVGLSGSHRLAAMAQIWEDDELYTFGERMIIELDAEAIHEAIHEAGDTGAARAMDSVFVGGRGRCAEIIRALMPYLPPNAVQALSDQYV